MKNRFSIEIRTAVTEFSGSRLTGTEVARTSRMAGHMEGVFSDAAALAELDPETLLYTVDSYLPVDSGTEGGLFFGITHIEPGTVGGEYFMTKGHFHETTNRSEFYWGIAGHGCLLRKSRQGDTWAEEVGPGTLHYIPGETAHRLVNTGGSTLDVGACWASDAGHDYGDILKEGFGVRVFAGQKGPEFRDN